MSFLLSFNILNVVNPGFLKILENFDLQNENFCFRSLYTNNMTGPLPPEIGNLWKLTSL